MEGREVVEDDPKSGRPCTFKLGWTKKRSAPCGSSGGHFGQAKVCAKMVPRFLD